VEAGDAACGFWCMVAWWCTRTSSSKLAVAMVAWLSASVETEGREEANAGNDSELIGTALEAPRSDVWPPHQCMTTRWRA
jgi:hypothetical protein